MSMLSSQIKRLRDMAEQTDWELPEVARELRQAADTIDKLRAMLQETCRNVDANADAGGVWHSPRFVCSECGAVYVMSDYAHFCPSCGRRVVS